MNHKMRFLLLLLFAYMSFACLCVAQNSPETNVKEKTVQERLGYPASARLLVIHADDLGMNHSVNRATFEALEKGWITSASILVPCPWFPEVARWAKQHPNADLGIHLALNSEWTTLRWGPVSPTDKVPSLLDAAEYLPLDTPAVVQNAKLSEVETELRAQVDRAQSAGIPLTHLDTHMSALFESADLSQVLGRCATPTVCPSCRQGREAMRPWERRRPRKKSWLRRSSRSTLASTPRAGLPGTGSNLNRSAQGFTRSSCISHTTTKRCGARPTIIPIGAPHGGNTTWTWSRARSSSSSSRSKVSYS